MSGKYLIVGLGNPGNDYAKTRHNVGFQVIDELARRHNMTAFTGERKALVANGSIKMQRVILAKPQTYMNLSGESIRALMDYYKIELDHLIVIHDDLDLPLGVLRLRTTGGHGGQNGVRNTIKHLGTNDFARVRFGIGRPPGKMQAKDHVLQKFSTADAITADLTLSAAANAVEVWLEEGIEKAMSQFNGDITDNGTQGKAQSATNINSQIQLAERAHELNPQDLKPLEELVRLYKKARRLDDAARAHLQLAELHDAAGNTARTIHEWESAVKVQPALVDVWEAIAHAYTAAENSKRAVQTWLKYAEYQERSGHVQGALQAVQAALQVNPQHPKAVEMQLAYQKKLTM